MTAHYLNVPGTEWEYKETDRNTGRQGRKVWNVPLFLDPRDAADHNYRELGEIIVSDGQGAMGRDIIFVGDPTPDMEPLDAAAEAISKSFEHRWIHPIESLPGQGYSQSLLDDLQRQIAQLSAGQQAKPAAPVSINGIDPQAFAEMQAQMKLLMEQNAALQNQLLNRPSDWDNKNNTVEVIGGGSGIGTSRDSGGGAGGQGSNRAGGSDRRV